MVHNIFTFNEMQEKVVIKYGINLKIADVIFPLHS